MTQDTTNTVIWDSILLDLICVLVGGKITFINTAGAKMLGAAAADQLIGKPILEFVHPDFRELAAERVQTVTTLGSVVCPSQETWLRLDGTAIAVEVVALPVIFRGQSAVQVIVRENKRGGPYRTMRDWQLPSHSRRRSHR